MGSIANINTFCNYKLKCTNITFKDILIAKKQAKTFALGFQVLIYFNFRLSIPNHYLSIAVRF